MLKRLLFMADLIQGGSTPAPLPTPTGGGDGSDSMATELLAGLTAAPEPAKVAPATPEPTKAPEPAKPAAAPAVKVEAKPEPKPAPAASKEPVNFDDPKLSAPDLRKHLKELQTRLTTTVTEKETAIGQLKTQLATLEAKKFWTDDDHKKFDELTAGKTQLEKQLYSRDYSNSPEYKKLFIDKINEQATEATEVISALTVTYTENDEEKTRTGTSADMLKLYNAPSNVERRNLAKQLFGDDFQEALDSVQPMIATRKASDQAIKDKATNFETEQTQHMETMKKNGSESEQFIKTATETLAKEKPDVFGVPENNPEEAALLKRGFDFVDEFSKNSANLPPAERLTKIALLRANAAAFPRLMFRIGKLTTELETLRAENATYRKSDPGGGGDGGTGAEKPVESASGTDALANEIAALERA